MMNLGALVGEWGALIPIVAIAGGLGVGVVAIIAEAIRKSVQTRHREETKREVAAYVAEGTMKPEDAERIIKADLPAWQKGEFFGKSCGR